MNKKLLFLAGSLPLAFQLNAMQLSESAAKNTSDYTTKDENAGVFEVPEGYRFVDHDENQYYLEEVIPNLQPLDFIKYARSGEIYKLKQALDAPNRADINATLPDPLYANQPFTALQSACMRNDILNSKGPVISALIKAGADIEKAAFEQEKPLVLAIKRGDAEGAKLLLEAGARTDYGPEKYIGLYNVRLPKVFEAHKKKLESASNK